MKHLLALFLLLVGTNVIAVDNAGLKAGAFDPPRVAPEIAWSDADGKALKLSQYRGKVVVLEFGFASCPEVCPVSLASLAAARKMLGADASNVQVVFVTVDPERDSAPKLRDFLTNFDSTFVGVTGTPNNLAAVRKDYGITATKHVYGKGKDDYSMDHSSYLYFIDREGKLRSLMPFGRPAKDIAHDLQILLKK